ncbi:MAG: protein phosphatase 2C domain-containing protein [Micropruina sp.]|uniref:PP2C family serine/threonine-protein phosphatase n=1 Tax=Micropruina sp. TaxID=2737536 RepID=UPI0039E2EDB9
MTDEPPAWPLWATEHDAAVLAGAQEYGTLALTAPCPACGVPVRPDQRYCENCGADVHPEVATTAAQTPVSEDTVKLNRPRPASAPCLECGGEVDADGYCQTCGAKAPSPRDHFEAAPASWLGGVCDRGLVHSRNEDAMALWAASELERAGILVVCDGVSSSQDSDVAALAAAERARDVLAARWSNLDPHQPSQDPRSSSSRPPAEADPRWSSLSRPLAEHAEPDPLTDALIAAVAEAQQAVVEHTAADSANAASCTLAAAVVHDGAVHWASLGDSRVYFLADDARVQLSTDHSVAEELIRGGLGRTEAENSRQAHAITRWLGRDADNIVPDTGVYPVTSDGWLVVCSDGLWNYASEPAALAEQVRAASEADDDPVRVAGRLVKWANTQGGKDNITVALARLTATLNGAPQAPSDDLEQPADSAVATSTSVEEKD